MKRALATTAVTGLFLLGAAPAFGASPSQQECEASGGDYNKVRGTVTCTYVTSDPVGNSERSGGKSQTVDTETTESSKGNLKDTHPKYDESTACSGPGNGKSQAGC